MANFNNANSLTRAGFEATQAVPAAIAVMDFEPPFSSTDVDPDKQIVANPNIRPSGHESIPIPGKEPVTGALNAALDADGCVISFLNALRNISAITDNGDGSYFYTASRSQTTAVPPTYTREVNRDDGIHSLHVGTACMQFQITLANAAPKLVVLNEESTYWTTWANSAERHPNPATGSIYLRGTPPDWILRADSFDDDAKDVYVKLVDLYTDSSNREWAVFMARIGRPGPITGTWTVTAGTKAFSGTGGAADTEIVSGDVLEVGGQLVTVDVVTDADTFTSVANHTVGATAAVITREYGITRTRQEIYFFEVRPGLLTGTGGPRYHSVIHSKGGFMGERATAGSTVELHLTSSAGIVAGTSGALTGTVTTAVGDATVTGSGTAFLSELRIGDQVTTAGGVVKRVGAIATDTSFEADSKYSAIEAGVAMTAKPIPTVALTGTVTTASDLTFIGVGTAFLTELAVGSWVRTAGGEVRRIHTITNDTTATVTRAFANAEAGVAATTDYEWQVPRERASWVAAEHASGPFPELLTDIQAFISGSGIPEEPVEIANSLTFTYVAGKARLDGIGSVHSATVKDSGQSTGTCEVSLTKINTDNRKAVMAGKRARLRVVCSTGVLVGSSLREYTLTWILQLKAGGKPIGIPDATSNLDRLGGGLYDNPDDADGYIDAVTLEVTSDRATPIATS